MIKIDEGKNDKLWKETTYRWYEGYCGYNLKYGGVLLNLKKDSYRGISLDSAGVFFVKRMKLEEYYGKFRILGCGHNTSFDTIARIDKIDKEGNILESLCLPEESFPKKIKEKYPNILKGELF